MSSKQLVIDIQYLNELAKLRRSMGNCSLTEASKAMGLNGHAVSWRLYKIKNRMEAAGLAEEYRSSVEDFEKVAVPKLTSDGVRRFIVTCAVSKTQVDADLWKALQNYARSSKADLYVIPQQYDNLDVFSRKVDDESEYDPELDGFLLNDKLVVNSNLTIMGDIPISVTAKNPLSGFETITEDYSGIFGSPNLALKSIPTPSLKLPKLLFTTGAVTVPNYSNTKTGKIAALHHTMGALMVEVVGEQFWVRQIVWDEKTKTCYDLENKITPKGVTKARVKAIVMGDLHYKFASSTVIDATYGKGGMVEVLKPETLVIHDALDQYAQNHHHNGQHLVQYAKALRGDDSVEAELEGLVKFHEKYHSNPDMEYLYVDSNHNRALDRWLTEGQMGKTVSYQNAKIWHELNYMRLEEVAKSGGTSFPDSLELYFRKYAPSHDNVQFVGETHAVKIGEFNVSMHGDVGANGARGSLRGYCQIGEKVITGHSHTPGIMLNSWQVGTSTRMNLEYVSGPSSWLNSHAVVYENGKASLVHIVGTWRAPDA